MRPEDFTTLVEFLARWCATAGLHADRLELLYRDKTVLLIPLPSGQPAPLVQAEGERGRPISQIRLDILTVLREAGKPLTTTRLLEAMALRKPPMEWSERSVSEHLARMVEDGTLENPDGARPRSYRFPQGEQPPA